MLRVLHEKPPRAEALLGKTAYAVDAAGKLHAWKLPSGEPIEESVMVFDTIARDRDALILTTSSLVELRYVNGGGHIVDPRATVTEGARFGDGVVARVGTSELFWGPRYRVSGTIESVIEDSRRAVAARPGAVCIPIFEPPNHRVECVAADLRVVLSATVSLARPSDAPGTRFHTRFVSPHHIVVGTFGFGGPKSTRRAGAVRLSDGTVTVVEDEVAAAVERADGTLEGLLVMTPEVKLLSPAGAVRWTYRKLVPIDEFAAVALIDERLVVAAYNAIATGVQVFALNVNDGKLLWKGETKLPPIGHSKYHNLVTIEALGDAVIVRGHESAVDHVHVYDSKTGALRFSDAQ